MRTGNDSNFDQVISLYTFYPCKVTKTQKKSITVGLEAVFVKKRDFFLFFNTFLYKMMQYQTNRFPHLFHKVLGADFLHTTFYWPSRHRVEICKGAYFRNIKLLFLGMLTRPVDLTDFGIISLQGCQNDEIVRKWCITH